MDLCKNCGSCHLGVEAVPCGLPLRRCDHCNNWGHSTNFCPLGSSLPNGLIGPHQMFMMICSNCDRWHLPHPCQVPLQKCGQCNNVGHISVHCPQDPVSRPRENGISQHQFGAQPTRPLPLPVGRKRKKHKEGDEDRLMVKLPLAVLDINHVHPVLVRQIQHHMAGQMIQMLTYHTRDDVLNFLQRQVPLPKIKTDPAPLKALKDAFIPQAVSQQQHPQQQLQLRTGLRNFIESPASEQTPGIPVTPETAQKGNKRTVTRCEDCKRRHIACSHVPGNEDYKRVPQPHLSGLPIGQGFRHNDGLMGSSGYEPFSAQQELFRQQVAAQAMGYGHSGYQGRDRHNTPGDVFTAQGRATFYGGAQHNAPGGMFTAQAHHQMEVPTGGNQYFHHHSGPAHSWSNGGGHLNALATAAAQVTSQAAQTEQTFDPYTVHSRATQQPEEHYNQDSAAAEQPNELNHNAMDFSNLLNSDAASAPAGTDEQLNADAEKTDAETPVTTNQDAHDEQTEQLNAELQDAAEIVVKQPKKRGPRKKKD